MSGPLEHASPSFSDVPGPYKLYTKVVSFHKFEKWIAQLHDGEMLHLNKIEWLYFKPVLKNLIEMWFDVGSHTLAEFAEIEYERLSLKEEIGDL